MQESFDIRKSISATYHSKELKKENGMITSIDAEKVMVNVYHYFFIKTSRKLEIEWSFLNL